MPKIIVLPHEEICPEGIEIDAEPILHNESFWRVLVNDEIVGHVSRCVFSPRLERNIGFANVPEELTEIGTQLVVKTPAGPANAAVVKTPWFPAQKILPDIRGDR